MRCMHLMTVLALVLIPALSSAEFYKYRDASGVLHYTDNLAEVPADQRPKIERYTEPDDFLTPEERAEKLKNTGGTARVSDKGQGETSLDKSQEKRMALNKTKMALDEEFGELMKKKQELLDAEKEAMKTVERTRAHREEVTRLNLRIVDFEKRRKAFETEVQDFNSRQVK